MIKWIQMIHCHALMSTLTPLTTSPREWDDPICFSSRWVVKTSSKCRVRDRLAFVSLVTFLGRRAVYAVLLSSAVPWKFSWIFSYHQIGWFCFFKQDPPIFDGVFTLVSGADFPTDPLRITGRSSSFCSGRRRKGHPQSYRGYKVVPHS